MTKSDDKPPECVVPPRHHIVLIVVYTLAFIALQYFATLCWCVINKIPLSDTLGSTFSQAGTTVIGLIGGMLIKTSSDPVPTKGNPVPTEIVNAPDKPVPVDETKNHDPS